MFICQQKPVLYDEFETLPALMAELNPQQKIDALAKFARYILPGVESVRMDEGEAEVTEEGIDLSRLSDEDLELMNSILGRYDMGGAA